MRHAHRWSCSWKQIVTLGLVVVLLIFFANQYLVGRTVRRVVVGTEPSSEDSAPIPNNREVKNEGPAKVPDNVHVSQPSSGQQDATSATPPSSASPAQPVSNFSGTCLPFEVIEEDGCVRKKFDEFYAQQSSEFQKLLAKLFDPESKFLDETLKVIKALEGKQFLGIIIYPTAGDIFIAEDESDIKSASRPDFGQKNTPIGVDEYQQLLKQPRRWYIPRSTTVQRVKWIMKEFAKLGFLALMADCSNHSPNSEFVFSNSILNDGHPNLYVYSYKHEHALLPILRSQHVIVLCTLLEQIPFAQVLLTNRFLWLDVDANFRDRSPFKGLDHRQMRRNLLENEADLVTYSTPNVKYRFMTFTVDTKDPPNLIEFPSFTGDVPQTILTHMRSNWRRGWPVFANNHDMGVGHISVLVDTFLDYDGANFFSGGAERYLIDLAKIAQDMNFTFVAYQNGNFPWVRRFHHFDVVSLYDRNAPQNTSPSLLYFNGVHGRTSLNIYSAFFEAWPRAALPCVGISHGVAWDASWINFNSGFSFWSYNKRFIESSRLCNKIVSVDTNTANWFQTIDYTVGSSMKVIPNYVDLDEFRPREGFDKLPNPSDGDRIRILYPRRLYEPRGLYIVLSIINPLLKEFPFVDFHFVGKGFKSDTKHVTRKIMRWKDRIRWYSLPPDRMWEAYRDADISLIPTLFSEGTSLSCLEAMASGNMIIATRVGGLTDLVIDEHNGYLIEPNADILLERLRTVLRDLEKLVVFKRRSVAVVSAFSKKKWESSWKSLITTTRAKAPAPIINKQVRDIVPGVIEIYVGSHNSFEQHPESSLLVTSLLENGALVYVRFHRGSKRSDSGFGRVQFMDWDTETFHSREDAIVLVEKEVSHLLNVQVEEDDDSLPKVNVDIEFSFKSNAAQWKQLVNTVLELAQSKHQKQTQTQHGGTKPRPKQSQDDVQANE